MKKKVPFFVSAAVFPIDGVHTQSHSHTQNYFLISLYISFAILSQQFYFILVPIGILCIIFQFSDNKVLLDKERACKLLIFILILITLTLPLFLIWGSTVPVNYSFHKISFDLTHLIATLMTIGIWFLPFTIKTLSVGTISSKVYLLNFSFLLVMFFSPEFAEKGGLTEDEINNIKQEYLEILSLIGLKIPEDSDDNQNNNYLESQDISALIELIRAWYRLRLKDPNLQEEDLYLIPQEWERKINILQKRSYRLYQKIINPQLEETRLDDYVLDLSDWLKSRFKERKKWQDPQIWVTALNHDEGYLYYQFQINFFVDDIKLEYGKRGDRISSQIYQEILRIIKPSWNIPLRGN